MTEREELLDLLHRHAVPIPREFRRLVLSVIRAYDRERDLGWYVDPVYVAAARLVDAGRRTPAPTALADPETDR